jgi:putative aldouronate transport system permease protein
MHAGEDPDTQQKGMIAQMRANISAGNTLALRIKKDFSRYKYVYLMVIPVLAYYLLFHYQPMYGLIIAFKNYSPRLGIAGSPWEGFVHFKNFFGSIYFTRTFFNTVAISFLALLFGFPIPILLALSINEVRSKRFRSLTQTFSYLPHFISVMVLCGMIVDFTAADGVINDIIAFFGGMRQTMLLQPQLFKPIYVISSIWQDAGWNSILFIAALTSIGPQLYEAARIEGAGRLQQMWHISLPGIRPTIVVLLIMRVGQIMNLGYEKVILLYNPVTYVSADVISSYVYRKGLLELNYSYSAAVGLFNSVINFALILTANWMSKRINETSLW